MTENTSIPVHSWKESSTPSGSFRMETWGNKPQDTSSLQPHRHDYHEIMCFSNGTFVHDIDFISHESSGREFHFVRSNSVHMMVREEAASGISLMFSPDFADAEVLTLLPFGTERPVIKSSESEYHQASAILQMIHTEYAQQYPGYIHVIRNYFNGFLWLLARIHAPSGTDHQHVTPDIYRKFTALLQQDPSKWRTVESIADELHVSPKHLIGIVRTYSGHTPLKLIHDSLLTESKRLLFHTTLPIKEIAYNLGFTDSTNFNKWFRSKTGYTPGAYRTAEGK